MTPKPFGKMLKIFAIEVNANKISLDSRFEHLKSLLQIPQQDNLEDFQYEEPLKKDIFDAPISEEEVTNNIKRIRSGKSGGPDGILIEMLKTTILMICPILTKLFNKIMDQGEFPESWGKSILCPILKKGNVNDPNNYRGISLIDVLNKIFTGIRVNI